jgi:hypothetical protein
MRRGLTVRMIVADAVLLTVIGRSGGFRVRGHRIHLSS